MAVRTALAIITPGRSLLPNAIMRSCAPAVSTARFATIFQCRWRGSCSGGSGHMIVDALDRGILAMIEHAGNCRAAHDAHVGQRRELGLDLRGPFGARLAVDLVSLRKQPPTNPEILVGEDHARARTPRRERRHQPGRTRADHQHIAVRESLLVMVRILRASRPAEPAARRISGSYTASQNFAGHMKVL